MAKLFVLSNNYTTSFARKSDQIPLRKMMKYLLHKDIFFSRNLFMNLIPSQTILFLDDIFG